MAPFGISNDLYFGHTFWDADVWMLPALLFTEPQAARDIVDYRLSLVEQARKNAAVTLKQPSKALQFPWESSVSGKETVPGESKKEHHITGSVLWGMTQAEAAGLVPSVTVKPIAQGAATFYQLRSKKTNRGREILDVMSPDENFIGDNDLYTNLLAQWLTNDRNWEGPTKFYLPKDDKSLLTYEHDPLRSYKQAAAVLAIYPLEFPEAEKNARAMMDRFESKVIKNGPAMTESVHSIIWARLGETDKALTAWKKSYEPFLVKGSNEFSEKRSTVRTYFYTGSAGVINSVIYGFAGIRLDKKPQQRATFSKQLKSGWYLSVTPHVPAELGDLQLTNLVIDGKTTSLKCTVDGKVTFQPPI
jgi:trehalose/maltose hydrolase-like predicted phosphorylase